MDDASAVPWRTHSAVSDVGTAAFAIEPAQAISDPDVAAAAVARWSQVEGLRVPPEVISYSPTQDAPLQVDVRRTLAGVLQPPA